MNQEINLFGEKQERDPGSDSGSKISTMLGGRTSQGRGKSLPPPGSSKISVRVVGSLEMHGHLGSTPPHSCCTTTPPLRLTPPRVGCPPPVHHSQPRSNHQTQAWKYGATIEFVVPGRRKAVRPHLALGREGREASSSPGSHDE